MSKSGIIAAVAAILIAIIYVEVRFAGSATPVAAPAAPADLEEFDQRFDRIERMLAKLQNAPPPALESSMTSEPISPESDEVGPDSAPDSTPVAAPAISPERKKQIEEYLARVEAGEVVGEEMNELWNLLRGSGMHNEALAALVVNAKARPNDADAQYGVGIGAISKLVSGQVSFGEQGQLSMLADGAFTKALEINDHHFGARFSKAVSYTYWPEAMGKGPAAIAEFEILREQSAKDPSIPMLDQVYTNLGIQYRKVGKPAKSRAALEEGLRLFPDSNEIQEQLKVLED